MRSRCVSDRSLSPDMSKSPTNCSGPSATAPSLGGTAATGSLVGGSEGETRPSRRASALRPARSSRRALPPRLLPRKRPCRRADQRGTPTRTRERRERSVDSASAAARATGAIRSPQDRQRSRARCRCVTRSRANAVRRGLRATHPACADGACQQRPAAGPTLTAPAVTCPGCRFLCRRDRCNAIRHHRRATCERVRHLAPGRGLENSFR